MTEKKQLLFLVVSAILVRLFYLFFFTDIYTLAGDAFDYHSFALEFLNGSGWLSSNFSDRMPLYPIFISLVYLIFGESVVIVKIIQIAIFGGGTTLLIYYLSKLLFSKKCALWASLMYVVYFNLVWIGSWINTEIVFITLLLGSIYYIIKAIQSNFKNTYIVLSALLLALATLTRPITIIMPAFLFLILVYKNQSPLRFILKKSVLFVCAFLLLYAPWVVRNYIVYKTFVPTMIETGYAFYTYNVSMPAGRMNINSEERHQNNGLNAMVEDKEHLRSSFVFLKKQKLKYFVKLLSVKFGLLLYPFLPTYDILYAFLLPFFLYCSYHVFAAKNRAEYILFIPMILIFIQTFIFSGSPRFRVMNAPIYLIMASNGIELCIKKYKTSANLFLLIWMLLNIFVFIYSDQIRIVLKRIWLF